MDMRILEEKKIKLKKLREYVYPRGINKKRPKGYRIAEIPSPQD